MRKLGSIPQKYVIALVAVFGLFMNLLDLTVINVAIPELAKDLGTSTSAVGWVVTGYMLSLAVAIPVSGWAGDRFGTKRTFMFALGLFTGGSLLCATAWNVESLVAFRVLQGAGGGLLTPVGTTMVFRAFSGNERSRAAVVLLVPTTIAPASGPIVGGFLVEYWSWPLIFLVNIPVGFAGLVAAGLLLKEHREEGQSRLDVSGLILAAACFPMLLYSLARIGTDGLYDAQALAFGTTGLVLLGTLISVELRTEHAIVALRLFRSRLFAASNIVAFVAMTGVAASIFILPLMLQSQRGLSPLESGLVTFPQAVGVGMISPLVGRLYNVIGPRPLVVASFLLAMAVYATFLKVDLTTSEWTIRGLMYLTGWSFGLMQVSTQASIFESVTPAQTGRASAVTNSIRQLGMAFGVAMVATVLSSRLAARGTELGDQAKGGAAITAFHEVFVVMTVVAAVGALLALVLIRRHPQTVSVAVAATSTEDPEPV